MKKFVSFDIAHIEMGILFHFHVQLFQVKYCLYFCHGSYDHIIKAYAKLG